MVDQTPDPIDRAYGDAEKLLDEQAERSARRARVLAAVAQDKASDPVTRQKPVARFASRGGWLVAASVVSVFLATSFLALREPWFSPPAAHGPAVQENKMTAALSPSAPVINQPDLAPAMPKVAPPDRASREAAGRRLALPEPPPVADVAAPPPPAAEAPPIVMTAPRAPMPAPLAAAPPPPAAPSPSLRANAAKPMAEPGIDPDVGQLYRAAAAGRTAEVQQLLDRHVPVDTTDAKGETALMKSIGADQPETAALLIRHGASLDRKNNAGFSARDLAAQLNDPALNHALGLEP